MGFYKQAAVSYEDDTTMSFERMLEGLQKQSRIIEQRAAPLSNFTPSVSRMMSSHIEKLKSENCKMKKQLNVESLNVVRSTETDTFTDEMMQNQERIVEMEEFYVSQAQHKSERINQIDRMAENIHNCIEDRRRQRGGLNAAQEKRNKMNKKIMLLDNRLHRARLDFNRRIEENRSIRHNIENMRIERVMDDRQVAHLVKLTTREEIKIGAAISQGSKRAEKRDSSTMEMFNMSQIANEDYRKFLTAWHDMGRLVSYNIQINQHICLLSDKRLLKDKVKWARAQQTELRKIMSAGAWDIAKDRAALKVTSKRVFVYENLFRRLEQATGVSGMQELVAVFEDSEDRNFKQFQVVNLLSNEIESLESSLQNMHESKERFLGENTIDSDVDADSMKLKLVSHQTIKELIKRKDAAEQNLLDLDDKLSDNQSSIAHLKRGIERILLFFEPETPEIRTRTMVTESTIMEYLSIMEDHINQLLNQYIQARNFSADLLNTQNSFDITTDVTESEVSIQPPTTLLPKNRDSADGSKSSSDDDFDYSHTFLTQHTTCSQEQLQLCEAKPNDDETDKLSSSSHDQTTLESSIDASLKRADVARVSEPALAVDKQDIDDAASSKLADDISSASCI